jgi:hypothetical protein
MQELRELEVLLEVLVIQELTEQRELQLQVI